MPSLTDGAIRNAIKQVAKLRKQRLLADGEGRGTGRLVLVLKPMPTRVTAEWMAQQWRDGRRVKSKIGAYPPISLSQAREIFKRDYADVILTGRSIKTASDARPGTVGDLFDAYVKHLKNNEQSSWLQVQKGLDKIAGTLGRNRLARDVTPAPTRRSVESLPSGASARRWAGPSGRPSNICLSPPTNWRRHLTEQITCPSTISRSTSRTVDQ